MAQVKLKILGGFSLSRGGETVRLGLRKGELLLAYLVLPPGRAQAREKLIELFWG